MVRKTPGLNTSAIEGTGGGIGLVIEQSSARVAITVERRSAPVRLQGRNEQSPEKLFARGRELFEMFIMPLNTSRIVTSRQGVKLKAVVLRIPAETLSS
jgi:hypothetical protein